MEDILAVYELPYGACKRQCIPGRIDSIERMRGMRRAWNEDRNTRQTKADWQFTVGKARGKPKRLYPKI